MLKTVTVRQMNCAFQYLQKNGSNPVSQEIINTAISRCLKEKRQTAAFPEFFADFIINTGTVYENAIRDNAFGRNNQTSK